MQSVQLAELNQRAYTLIERNVGLHGRKFFGGVCVKVGAYAVGAAHCALRAHFQRHAVVVGYPCAHVLGGIEV